MGLKSKVRRLEARHGRRRLLVVFDPEDGSGPAHLGGPDGEPIADVAAFREAHRNTDTVIWVTYDAGRDQ